MVAVKNSIGLFEKQCCKCKEIYIASSLEAIRESYFSRDPDTPDLLSRTCKKCVSEYNKQDKAKRKKRARDKKYRLKEIHKERARDASKKFYSGKKFKCAVLTCNKDHEELHHINYNDYLAVIPLCISHHADAHTIPVPVEEKNN